MTMNVARAARSVAIATVVIPWLTSISAQTASPRVTIRDGTLQGALSGDIESFKGIPYAAPPVGNLRWRAPRPVKAWRGVRNAIEYGNDCSQKPVAIDAAPGGAPTREDCLYLNVWRPTGIRPAVGLPVMVWIHGGGYVNGGGSSPIDDGSALARQGLVVVSINYRLGRLGFFAHPALIAAKEGPVGNFGYMDQIQALKWVQRNIAAFGGDPRRVTVTGQSAGGFSVMHLLTSPMTRGLFHQAIVMSGGGRRGIADQRMTGGTATRPSVDQIDATFARSLGIDGAGRDALRALRGLPAETIVDDLNMLSLARVAVMCVYQVMESVDAASACTPLPAQGIAMVDGMIVTAEPQDLLRQGRAAHVPLIIGTTASDLAFYFPPSLSDPFVYFGGEADNAREAYGVPAKPDGKARLAALLAIGDDMTMHEPARFVARQMAEAGSPAWLYRFTYTAESTRPASMAQEHAGELPFMNRTLSAKYGDKVTSRDRETANAFSTYIANFVKTGDPNGGGLPRWSMFDPARVDLMEFTLDNGPVFGPDPRPGVALVERAVSRRR